MLGAEEIVQRIESLTDVADLKRIFDVVNTVLNKSGNQMQEKTEVVVVAPVIPAPLSTSEKENITFNFISDNTDVDTAKKVFESARESVKKLGGDIVEKPDVIHKTEHIQQPQPVEKIDEHSLESVLKFVKSVAKPEELDTIRATLSSLSPVFPQPTSDKSPLSEKDFEDML